MANRDLVQAIRRDGIDAITAYRAERPRDILDLKGAILPKLDLSRANLMHADLRDAYLSESSLKRADLRMANLAGANVDQVDFSGAAFLWTTLCNMNLNRAEGLEKIDWQGPCDIGLSTLAGIENPALRKVLIRGCGLSDSFGNAVAELEHDSTAERCVFLTFIRRDGGIARMIQKALEAADIRTYLYPIDQPREGKLFSDMLADPRAQDWVVFLASQACLENADVEIHLEKIVQAGKLRPVALDGFMNADWHHYMRNDVMQLPVVSFDGAKTPEVRAEACERVVAAVRRGVAGHL